MYKGQRLLLWLHSGGCESKQLKNPFNHLTGAACFMIKAGWLVKPLSRRNSFLSSGVEV
jgi:hypothetical protein